MLALLLSLRGAAFLYQGDELGLPHADVPFDRLRDPEAIAFWPNGIGRDGARTPMPWTQGAPMAGFTDASDAWLPLDPHHRALSVDAQEHDPNSVLAFTREMIALRRVSAALREGDVRILDAPNGVFAFERRAPGEGLVCLFNLSPMPARTPLPAPGKAVRLTLGGAAHTGGEAQLPAFSALFVRK